MTAIEDQRRMDAFEGACWAVRERTGAAKLSFSHGAGHSWACLSFDRTIGWGRHINGAELQVYLERGTGTVRIWSWSARTPDDSWSRRTSLDRLCALGALARSTP